MTLHSIGQMALFYIIAVPFYLTLAAHSLRYYVKKNSNSSEQLTRFLNSLLFPLNLFFNTDRAYTFARILTIRLEFYYFNSNRKDLLINRIVSFLVSIFFALAILISYLVSHVSIDVINLTALILHILTFIWAFRFGANIS